MTTKTVRNAKGDPTEESQIRSGAFSLVFQIFGIKSLKHYQKELNWIEFLYFKLAQIYIKNIAHIIYV